jgi:DNA-binding response OmpR family regulator
MKEKPDLVILDIMMPGMDGYQVCKRIKENEETKSIPVIMLSAKHEIDDVKQAIKADVDEYITKPFEPDMLKKRVDENLFSNKINDKRNAERKLFRYGKSLHYVRESMRDNKIFS